MSDADNRNRIQQLIWDATTAGHGMSRYRIEGVLQPDAHNGLEEPCLRWTWADPAPKLYPLSKRRRFPRAQAMEDVRAIARVTVASAWLQNTLLNDAIIRVAVRYGPWEFCRHGLPHTHAEGCAPTCSEPTRLIEAWATLFDGIATGIGAGPEIRENLGIPEGPILPVLRELAPGPGLVTSAPHHGHGLGGLFDELVMQLSEAERPITGVRRCEHCWSELPSEAPPNTRFCPGPRGTPCQLERKATDLRRFRKTRDQDVGLTKKVLEREDRKELLPQLFAFKGREWSERTVARLNGDDWTAASRVLRSLDIE